MTRPPGGGERFEEVYRTTGTAVLGYALRRCGSREDALDVVAETFAVAWRRRADLPPDPDEVRPWLFGIARNCLANSLRSAGRSGRLGERLAAAFEPGAVPDPAVIHERSADARRVREALKQLPEEDRELISLVAWEGFTPAQASAVLDLPPGTVRVRLHRARGRLRTLLATTTSPEETSDEH
ncbi:RNA polymerase sigma-70 factor, ECF subfamily [Blastococcus aurantiacus]|uniref:RNA polymerase sigma-70 factor, ECF subfamily n=1 Tax=Blastococcus aurantiacus TaxID=1550231 RepID=A0A1G7HHG7_9ACTN|nr:sigma-70 family RNA polymerase sigma factor [Blastococcus aurantiacus]SDE99838.1 RNA polymerase sigma-70 factor, ECF subfamily [Blastococcus aurantiacus]